MRRQVRSKRSEPTRRRAVVTGASFGIGRAFAERLARDQYDLIIAARSRDRLKNLAQRLQRDHDVTVEPLALDLSEQDDLRALEHAVASDGRLELLVNNAAIGTTGQFNDLDIDREEAAIRLNVTALVRLTRAALPGMLSRGLGAVINVSSLGGFQPMPYNATYGATKAFVSSFTEALYEEIRGSGVRIQLLCPGSTRTEFQKRAGMDTSRLPGFAILTPEAVVDESLSALQRGTLVCVPGLYYRALSAATSAIPRSVLRRLTASLARQFTH